MNGVIIFDGEKIKDVGGDSLFSVPLERLAGDKLMSNTVALGAALGLVEYDFEILAKVLRDHFGTGNVGEDNVKAARAGYEYSQKEFKREFSHRLSPISASKKDAAYRQ